MLGKKDKDKKETSLEQTFGGVAHSRPDFIDKSRDGVDHIEKRDMQLPRIALAQKTSREIDADEEGRFVEDLKVGDMFNNLTQEVYGRGPLHFVVLRADTPRGIQFNPIDEGGGVVDLNVPLDDPRMEFRDGAKPIATMFYDFIIQLLPTNDESTDRFSGQVVALSFKSTGLKVARQLNTYMLALEAPCYAGDYELRATMDKNRFGSYAAYVVRPLGWCSSLEEYNRRMRLYESYKEKNIVIDRGDAQEVREDVDEDVEKTPF